MTDEKGNRLETPVLSERASRQIHDLFGVCVTDTLSRVRASLSSGKGNHKPFHSRLLPKEGILWSKFERSFSTSFGQKAVESISAIVARDTGAQVVERQHETAVTLDRNTLQAIDQHIQLIREGRISGHWERDLHTIANVKPSGNKSSVRVISDLYFRRNGVNNYFSIKTVKPNIDQTAEAKKDLLRLKFNDPSNNKVYFGLYYNPFGEGAKYEHNPPRKVFGFDHDESVLIGSDYWAIISGSRLVYKEILDIATSVGATTKQLIENAQRNW